MDTSCGFRIGKTNCFDFPTVQIRTRLSTLLWKEPRRIIMSISQSVGRNAANQKDDVRMIQALLNLNIPRMPGLAFLTEDGAYGQHTQAAIEQFQNQIATPGSASGVIQPGDDTYTA